MFHRITHIQSLQNAIQRTPLQAELTFKPGEIFRGTVIQRRPEGGVLVAAKGREFLAYTKLSLTEGHKHHFQVKSIGSKIELKVLDEGILKLNSPVHLWASSRMARDKLAGILLEISAANNLKGLAPASTQAFKDLHQLLPAIIYGKPGDNDVLWLSRNLLGSGLFWENKVARLLFGNKKGSWNRLSAADMKGILLSLDKNLRVEGYDQNHVQSLSLKIKQALHLIEQDQFLNLSSVREGLGWFWFIPGFAGDGFRRAELFVKKKETAKEIYFSIFLEFTHLGEMEVSVSIVESVIGVNIVVEDMEKEEFISRHLPLLETSLQNAGMDTGLIVCNTKEKQDHDFATFYDENSFSPSIHLVI